MSRVNVWWPMFPADFNIDTEKLTHEQIAVYVLLLNHYWREEGNLPTDNKSLAKLARLSTQKFAKMRPRVEKLFSVDSDGVWHHEKLDTELKKASDNREKRQKAANKRWGKNDAHAYAHASKGGMHMQCPSPSPSPKPSNCGLGSTTRGNGEDSAEPDSPTARGTQR